MSFIIQDIRVFDGESITEKTRVLVKNGIVSQIGPDVKDPKALIISKPGHTLLPGLIDAHCHPYRESRLPEQAFRFGITTIMDLHNLDENAKVQKQWARDRRDFPDVKSSHFAATIENGWPAWVEKRLSNNEVMIFLRSISLTVLKRCAVIG
jgi:predicted amidohydrolase YtcJ